MERIVEKRLSKGELCMQEIFKKMKEKLEELALEHAITGQQFDDDGYVTHAAEEYGKRDGLYEAAKEVERISGQYPVSGTTESMQQRGVSPEEAVEFLGRYMDSDVYTDKCIESHQIAIDAIRTLQILPEDEGFQKFMEEREQHSAPKFEQKCANPCTEEERQMLNNNVRKIGGKDYA